MIAQSAGGAVGYSHGYDAKVSDDEVPEMLELWGMRSTPSLSLLPGSICGSNRTKLWFQSIKKSIFIRIISST